MVTYGLTDDGFVAKPLQQIKSELEAALLSEIDPALNLAPESVYGQIVGILADRERRLWELAEAVYASQYRGTASGQPLDYVAALTGTRRKKATASTVQATLTGTPSTVVPSGSVASVDGNSSARFATQADATIASVSAWSSSTSYSEGDRVTNDGNIYQATSGGTSAGSGGPTGTGDSITDNTVTWRFVGEGTGAVDVTADAEDTGPVVGNAWTLTTIETPVSGWDGVNNDEDATLGRERETDAELRERSEQEVAAGGNATVDAIRAALLALTGMREARVFENDTDSTNAAGMPAKSIEAVAWDGTDSGTDISDDTIAQTVWDNVAGGIEPHGSDSGTATDASGTDRTVAFTRPTVKDVHLELRLSVDSTEYPGDSEVKQAVVDYSVAAKTEGFGIGDDVILSRLHQPLFRDVEGIDDVVEIRAKIGGAPGAGDTSNLTIGDREVADLDTSRITIVQV